MADSTLALLSAASSVAAGDLFYMVTSDGSAEYKATRDQILAPTVILSTATGQTLTVTDSATNASTTTLTISHDTSGTAAAGFGQTVLLKLQDSTTADVNAVSLVTTWATATHASRKARTVLNVYDTAAREILRGEASGTAPMIGFLGASAVAAQTGDAGTALVTFGLMTGTPTFAVGNLTGTGVVGSWRTTNAQTDTTYTLALTDAGKLVTLSNAGAITLTVDTNANVAFATNTEIELAQLGAGQVTVAAAGGVTINSLSGNLKLAGQYATAKLKKIATDTWLLSGSLTA